MIKHIIDTITNNSMFFISILIFLLFMVIGFFGDRHFKKKYSIKDKKNYITNDGLHETNFKNKENILKKVETNMEPAIEIKLPTEGNNKKVEKQKEDKKNKKYVKNIKETIPDGIGDKKNEESSLLNNDDWGSFNFDNVDFEKSNRKDNSDEEENVNNIFWFNRILKILFIYDIIIDRLL